MDDERDQMVHIWDTTRRTVESLDRSIIEIRKSYLTILGLIGSIGVALFGLKLNNNIQIPSAQLEVMATAAGSFIASFTIVFWGMDVHYHSYLKVSVATAKRIEKKLELSSDGDGDGRLGVTHEMAHYRRELEYVPKFFHLIYLIPGLTTLLIMMYLSPGSLRDGTLGGLAMFYVWLALWAFFIAFWTFSDWRVDSFTQDKTSKVPNKYGLMLAVTRAAFTGFMLILLIEMFPELAAGLDGIEPAGRIFDTANTYSIAVGILFGWAILVLFGRYYQNQIKARLSKLKNRSAAFLDKLKKKK